MITTLSVDIKRMGGIVAGHEQPFVTVYSGVACLELYPIDPHLRSLLPIKPMGTILQTITYDVVTILENDLLVVSGIGEYPIIAVETWYSRPMSRDYLVLTLEDAN